MREGPRNEGRTAISQALSNVDTDGTSWCEMNELGELLAHNPAFNWLASVDVSEFLSLIAAL